MTAQGVGATKAHDDAAESLGERDLHFPIRASKLRPPPSRRGSVPRLALLPRLGGPKASPVTVIVAPAGYGKTTLLSQWAGDQGDQVAWLSVDDEDNDPVVLGTSIAAAVARVQPVDPKVFSALGSGRPAVSLLTPLLAAFDAFTAPLTLIIDHLDGLTNPECLDLVGGLAEELPEHTRLIASSRIHVRLRLARLRVEGRLLEIGPQDLAFDHDEAEGLLANAGVDVPALDVPALVEGTEGWPAGLYLAALATQVAGRGSEATVALGDSRFVGDYLRSEILDKLSPDEAAFLTRTSILDTLTGPICDAVLNTSGSAARLEDLEGRNLLVFPVDGGRQRYRYHRLFRDLLLADLASHEPELVPELHARAATWCQTHGYAERAVFHAQAALDPDRVAALIEDLMQLIWATGRAETVMRWLDWLAEQDVLDRYPTLAVHGALIYALLGHPAQAEMWTAGAERATRPVSTSDGSSPESLLAYLRAFLCRDGIKAMRADAILSNEGLGLTSPYRASMLLAEGVSYLLENQPDPASARLARALDAALAIGADPVAAYVLANQGVIAAERNDWADATDICERALSLLAAGTYDEYWTSALVFAFAARVRLHAGRTKEAVGHLASAARLRPLLTYAIPAGSTMVLIEMARAYLLVGDPAGAQAVLRQAQEILQQRPDLGRLGPDVVELSAQLDAATGAVASGSSLSAAELRLAPLLATRLTLQEIGDCLYIARSTVKSQTISIYRKLGVSSRRDAVDALHELGLIVR